MSKDIEQLSKLVNLAERPSDAVWETHEFGRGGIGPSDWAVIAVLEYPRETLEAILAKSPASQNAQAVLPKNAGWLPKEARDIVAPDGRVNGSIRSAQLFERSPLTHGYLVPIPGTQKLLLYLQTS